MAQELGDKQSIVHSLLTLARISLEQKKYQEAIQRAEEGLILARQLSNKFNIANYLVLLGEIELENKKFPSAKTNLRAGLNLFYELGRKSAIIDTLNLLSSVIFNLATYSSSEPTTIQLLEQSVKLAGAVESLSNSNNYTLKDEHLDLHKNLIETASTRLSPVIFNSLFVKGQALSLDEAVKYAFSDE
jgi:tetratricopeptide (TPR) repeat protein